MKKFLAVLMAAAMMVALVACSSGGNTANNGSSNNSGNGADASGDGAIVIKIGGIGPLTGDTAVYGIATQNGAQIAVTRSMPWAATSSWSTALRTTPAWLRLLFPLTTR